MKNYSLYKITDQGSVLKKCSLLLNDKTVTFPSEQIEYENPDIDYDDASTVEVLIEMAETDYVNAGLFLQTFNQVLETKDKSFDDEDSVNVLLGNIFFTFNSVKQNEQKDFLSYMSKYVEEIEQGEESAELQQTLKEAYDRFVLEIIMGKINDHKKQQKNEEPKELLDFIISFAKKDKTLITRLSQNILQAEKALLDEGNSQGINSYKSIMQSIINKAIQEAKSFEELHFFFNKEFIAIFPDLSFSTSTSNGLAKKTVKHVRPSNNAKTPEAKIDQPQLLKSFIKDLHNLQRSELESSSSAGDTFSKFSNFIRQLSAALDNSSNEQDIVCEAQFYLKYFIDNDILISYEDFKKLATQKLTDQNLAKDLFLFAVKKYEAQVIEDLLPKFELDIIIDSFKNPLLQQELDCKKIQTIVEYLISKSVAAERLKSIVEIVQKLKKPDLISAIVDLLFEKSKDEGVGVGDVEGGAVSKVSQYKKELKDIIVLATPLIESILDNYKYVESIIKIYTEFYATQATEQLQKIAQHLALNKQYLELPEYVRNNLLRPLAIEFCKNKKYESFSACLKELSSEDKESIALQLIQLEYYDQALKIASLLNEEAALEIKGKVLLRKIECSEETGFEIDLINNLLEQKNFVLVKEIIDALQSKKMFQQQCQTIQPFLSKLQENKYFEISEKRQYDKLYEGIQKNILYLLSDNGYSEKIEVIKAVSSDNILCLNSITILIDLQVSKVETDSSQDAPKKAEEGSTELPIDYDIDSSQDAPKKAEEGSTELTIDYDIDSSQDAPKKAEEGSTELPIDYDRAISEIALNALKELQRDIELLGTKLNLLGDPLQKIPLIKKKLSFNDAKDEFFNAIENTEAKNFMVAVNQHHVFEILSQSLKSKTISPETFKELSEKLTLLPRFISSFGLSEDEKQDLLKKLSDIIDRSHTLERKINTINIIMNLMLTKDKQKLLTLLSNFESPEELKMLIQDLFTFIDPKQLTSFDNLLEFFQDIIKNININNQTIMDGIFSLKSRQPTQETMFDNVEILIRFIEKNLFLSSTSTDQQETQATKSLAIELFGKLIDKYKEGSEFTLDTDTDALKKLSDFVKRLSQNITDRELQTIAQKVNALIDAQKSPDVAEYFMVDEKMNEAMAKAFIKAKLDTDQLVSSTPNILPHILNKHVGAFFKVLIENCYKDVTEERVKEKKSSVLALITLLQDEDFLNQIKKCNIKLNEIFPEEFMKSLSELAKRHSKNSQYAVEIKDLCKAIRKASSKVFDEEEKMKIVKALPDLGYSRFESFSMLCNTAIANLFSRAHKDKKIQAIFSAESEGLHFNKCPHLIDAIKNNEDAVNLFSYLEQVTAFKTSIPSTGDVIKKFKQDQISFLNEYLGKEKDMTQKSKFLQIAAKNPDFIYLASLQQPSFRMSIETIETIVDETSLIFDKIEKLNLQQLISLHNFIDVVKKQQDPSINPLPNSALDEIINDDVLNKILKKSPALSLMNYASVSVENLPTSTPEQRMLKHFAQNRYCHGHAFARGSTIKKIKTDGGDEKFYFEIAEIFSNSLLRTKIKVGDFCEVPDNIIEYFFKNDDVFDPKSKKSLDIKQLSKVKRQEFFDTCKLQNEHIIKFRSKNESTRLTSQDKEYFVLPDETSKKPAAISSEAHLIALDITLQKMYIAVNNPHLLECQRLVTDGEDQQSTFVHFLYSVPNKEPMNILLPGAFMIENGKFLKAQDLNERMVQLLSGGKFMEIAEAKVSGKANEKFWKVTSIEGQDIKAIEEKLKEGEYQDLQIMLNQSDYPNPGIGYFLQRISRDGASGAVHSDYTAAVPIIPEAVSIIPDDSSNNPKPSMNPGNWYSRLFFRRSRA
jgi:hypothetical protein